MKITITPAEIHAAREIQKVVLTRTEYTNPVALAMLNAGYPSPWANRLDGTHGGSIGWKDHNGGMIQSMPPAVKAFLWAYDNFIPVQPIDFKIYHYRQEVA